MPKLSFDEKDFSPLILEEWEIYVSSLTPEQLRSKAMAMNCIQFVRMLEADGFGADYIESVFKLFGNRFISLGLEPPCGGYVDLKEIL